MKTDSDELYCSDKNNYTVLVKKALKVLFQRFAICYSNLDEHT